MSEARTEPAVSRRAVIAAAVGAGPARSGLRSEDVAVDGGVFLL